MAKLTYAQQLKHPNWQRRRLEILKRDEFTCQLCYDSESTLHVHHKHYTKGKLPWEYSDDALVTVCETCHESMNYLSETVKDVMATLPVDGPYSVSEALSLVVGWSLMRVDHKAMEWLCPPMVELGVIAGLIYEAHSGTITELKSLRIAMDSLTDAERKDVLSGLVAQITASKK